MNKPPIDLTESAAGEEDPGANIELTKKPVARKDQSVPAPSTEGECETCERTDKVDVSIGPA